MKKLSFLVIFNFVALLSNAQWLSNMDDAKIQAQQDDKLILLNFSGSDWCINCMKLHQDIFDNSDFQSYATKNLVLVNADFPRKKKNQLSMEQQEINAKLADKYNPHGNFPYTLLLDNQGTVIKSWDGYYTQGANSFIMEVDVYKDHAK